MSKVVIIISAVLLIVMFILAGVAFGWFNSWFGNNVDYVNHKIDDQTSYHTKREVENSCRAMISSYEYDKLTYEQYKYSDNKEQRSWAEQAKMRANSTASTYNNYILKNSYVWEDNIPNDLKSELILLE